MYTPTFEESYLCMTGKRSCEYGVCDECTLHVKQEEGEEVDEEQRSNSDGWSRFISFIGGRFLYNK